MSAAFDRLNSGYYNSANKTDTNPGGMSANGHQTNFPAALQDIATVAAEIVANAGTATTAAANALTSASEAAASAAAALTSSQNAASSASAASGSASSASTSATNASNSATSAGNSASAAAASANTASTKASEAAGSATAAATSATASANSATAASNSATASANSASEAAASAAQIEARATNISGWANQAATEAANAAASASAAGQARLDAQGYAQTASSSADRAENAAASIEGLNLTGAAKALVTATDVKAVFVYDTRKDSDGGAWRKKCRNLSWYTEPLNTATRGATREFPQIAVIVAVTGRIYIFDATKPDMPSWVEFPLGMAYAGWGGTHSLFALNGRVYKGTDNSAFANGDLYLYDFPNDEVQYWTTAGLAHSNKFSTIAQRGSVGTSSVVLNTTGIVSSRVNAVTARVLPGAPVRNGLPVPTVAVATAGGVSVIHPDGTVADAPNDIPVARVAFLSDSRMAVYRATEGTSSDGRGVIYVGPVPYSDAVTAAWSTAKYYAGQDLILPDGSFAHVPSLIDGAVGKNVALALLDEDEAKPTNGSVALITSTYNTGHMPGDIRACLLAGTATGAIDTGYEPSLYLAFDRGEFDSRITFARDSEATYIDPVSGLVTYAAANEPRFEKAASGRLGLKVEESRTNLLVNSHSFDLSPWLKYNTKFGFHSNWFDYVVNDAAVKAPDGGNSAMKVSRVEAGQTLFLRQTGVNWTAGQTYTLSFYLYYPSGADLTMNMNNDGHGGFVIAPAAAEWRRYSITFTAANPLTGTNILGLECAPTSPFWIWGLQLEVGSFATSYIPTLPTFTSRSSEATYTGADGLIHKAAANVLRYEHSPTDLTLKPRMLLEGTATNMLVASSLFDDPAWEKAFVSVLANVAVAPDGSLSADAVIESSANGDHYVQDITIPANTEATHTFSVYLKSAGRTEGEVTLYDSVTANSIKARFDLATGTVTAIQSGTGTVLGARLENVGNGWFRVSVSGKAAATDSWSFYAARIQIINASTTYTGDGKSGFYVWGAQLETSSEPTSYVPPTYTFTSRASTGTYFDSNGVLQTAATNVARTTYNPANLKADPVLLLEPQRTNLLTYSSDFANAAWTKVGATVAANAAAAPDGSNALSLLSDASATEFGAVQQGISVPADTQSRVLSCFVKAGTASQTTLRCTYYGGTAIYPEATITWGATPTIVAANGAVSAQLHDCGNGIYRASFVSANNGTNAGAVVHIFPAGTGAASNTGTVFAWGAQLEQGSYPTSYIPTTSAAATRSADVYSTAAGGRAADVYSTATKTRAADVASIDGVSFSEWYNPVEGTVLADVELNVSNKSGLFWNLSDGVSFGGSMYVAKDNANRIFAMPMAEPTNLNIAGGAFTGGAVNVAMAYKLNDFAMSRDGGAAIADTAAAPQSNINQLQIGASGWGGYPSNILNGIIHRLAYFPERLPNDVLQEITA